jgi:hypothetical protein
MNIIDLEDPAVAQALTRVALDWYDGGNSAMYRFGIHAGAFVDKYSSKAAAYRKLRREAAAAYEEAKSTDHKDRHNLLKLREFAAFGVEREKVAAQLARMKVKAQSFGIEGCP